MSTRRWLIAIGIALAILLLVGRGLAAVYVDYLWYASLGAAAIWKVKTVAGASVWIFSTLAGIAFVFANLLAVRRTVASVTLPSRVANLEIGEELPPRYLTIAAAVLSVVLGLILTIPRSKWPAIELLRTGEAFGESDPYFQRDLSFWIAQLPFETDLFLWSLIAVLLVTVVVVFFYAMTRSVHWTRGGIVVGPHARRHFSVLGALMLLLLAWSYRLDSFELLNLGSGHDGAFTYLDHHVAKPVGAVLAVVSAAAALVVLITGWMGHGAAAGWTVGGVLLLSLLLHQVGPLLARRAAEPRDPDRRERPYLATRAGYTRRAYAIDRIEDADSTVAFRSTRDAASGMPIWDAAALAPRPGRPGTLTAIGWERRGDVPSALIVRTGDEWSVMSVDTRRTDGRGAPVRVDESTDALLLGRAPLIHPGATGFRVVGDSSGRVVAARLDRGLARLAHAWSLQEFGLLSGDLPHPVPRIAIRRDVRERIGALVPFFVVGSDIAPLVDGDSLLWVAHLYSASSSYPLSRRFVLAGAERAYLQHAAVALVDAASGRVTFVADSVLDPVARGWIRRFPSMFRERALAPASVRRIAPGADHVRAQALGFAAAGTRTESVPRHVPWQDGADSAFTNGPPTPAFLPAGGAFGASHVQLLLDGLERVAGTIVVTGGSSPRTRWVPASGSSPRWLTVLEQMRGADSASAAGSTHARGAVRALPIADSLVLIQTTYVLQSGLPPSVSRVTVLAGGRVMTARSLADALGVSGADLLDTTLTPADLRTRVTDLYDAMRRAMQRGDWTAFGDAYTRLGALLGRPPR